jgi:hypothetical protein
MVINQFLSGMLQVGTHETIDGHQSIGVQFEQNDYNHVYKSQ